MSPPLSIEVLVVFDSRHGATAELARHLCRGVESVDGVIATLRRVPAVSAESERPVVAVPDSGAPWVSHEDLRRCDGLLLGSPTRFGNMSAAMKPFLDGTSTFSAAGALSGKPAGVFGGSSSLHGGQESTLLTMLVPLLHHGMVIAGIPYSERALADTRSGGTPYGATHFTPHGQTAQLTEHERALARAQGERIATLARALKARRG